MPTPAKFNRRSTRLNGYDYASAGAYFVTICANENDRDIVCTGDACVALNSNSTSKSNSNPPHVFGRIENGKIILNDLGRIIEQRWNTLSDHHPMIIPDEFVIMPNHVHFILIIENACAGEACLSLNSTSNTRSDAEFRANDDVRATQASPLQTRTGTKTISGSLGAIVGSFKSSVTRHINQYRGTPGAKVWQRNYFDRIIRNDDELNRIREYIINNPVNWDEDENNPNRVISP